MKIKFDPNQTHQRRAWESAESVFEGQELNKTTFSMPSIRPVGDLDALMQTQTDKGFGNRLRLLDEEIQENVRKIQLNNGLKQTKELKSRDFTIEMETGTGKTYVYLRSVFEMNKKYGFTKFIIVVPSIAIKEGVYKSLQMTETHFREQYDNVPFDYFVYDSGRLEQVRSFATNDYIQIMVINIDAFRKSFTDPSKETSANIIHRWNDKMQGVPIDFIKSTNPIVIIDEPQSVDTTAKSAEAIKSLNPLCTFRYSATHVDKHNMLYKLDSIDAYEQKLVKQIEVASIQVKDGHNKAYIKLLAVDNKNGHRAKIEIDIQQQGNVKRAEKWVKQGDDLLSISGGRSIYDGYVVNDIYCEEGNEYIDFTSKPDIIRLHHAIGDVSEDEYKRLQIRKTIEEHLDKELKLTPMGIKVLSLFFIDKVANYRDYDAPDQKGKYAIMFEEEYAKAIKKPKYNSLFSDMDTDSLPEIVHNGYFSGDKNGFKDTNGTTKADEDTYSLIMKDKEKLLSFDSKLKFIFSHSALKEGWDNPNVFQICTLRDMGSERERRQTLGRGLRLCVDQNGMRLRGNEINTLTVIATENYEKFAENLQKEIEQDTGIRFGIVEEHQFADIKVVSDTGEPQALGFDQSKKVWQFLKDENFVDAKGKVQDTLRAALKDGTFELPEEIKQELVDAHGEAQAGIVASDIQGVLRKLAGKLDIKNADDRKIIRTREAVLESDEFKALWDRIKYKTTYRVDFDNLKLINDCAEAIRACPPITKTRAQFRKADIAIGKGGVTAGETSASGFTTIHENDIELPDIITDLQDKTQLTRKSIVQILRDSRRLQDFTRNPQQFMDYCSEAINRTKRLALVDGIRYTKIGEDHFYAQELFKQEELKGYLKNTLETQKSVYTHVVYDSGGVEKTFAEDLEKNEKVKVYAKLPAWFKVPTPLGTYNPDWAVVVEDNGEEKLYFVVETKGSTWWDDLRHLEGAKIKCGEKHFDEVAKDIENPAQYIKSTDVDGMMRYVE